MGGRGGIQSAKNDEFHTIGKQIMNFINFVFRGAGVGALSDRGFNQIFVRTYITRTPEKAGSAVAQW